MRDSRIGAYGAAGVALDLSSRPRLLAGAAAAGANAVVPARGGRSGLARRGPPLARLLPYARADGGPGRVLSGPRLRLDAAGGAVVAAALASGSPGSTGAAVGLAAAAALAGGLLCRAWLGGVTGDTLGAVTEVAELGALALLVALA